MLVLKNAFLIDGTGQEPQAGMTVVIEGKTITLVGKDLPVPEGAQVIDLQGKTLLPGFSDAHTHIGGCDTFDRPGLSGRFQSYDYAANREAALSWGVTAVRSGGDFTPDILSFRDDVNAGKVRAPRVIACGRFIQALNGHPGYTVFFSDQNILDNAMVLVDEQTDIEGEVKKLVDAGVDIIKTFISDDKKVGPGSVPRLSVEQLQRISDAAHKHGKRLMVHVDDLNDMADAVLIGADTIEHTINIGTSAHEVSDELLKALTSREIWVVPSMIATQKHDGAPGLTPVYPALEKVIRQFIEAGVKIGVGCDSGIPFVPYGECVHMEMELLAGVGMTPLQVITAATGGNAKMFGQEDIFGTVTPGKAADLVVLASNPLEDIKNTRDIQLVFRDGRIVVDKFFSN